MLSVALHDVSLESWPRCERLLQTVHSVAPVAVTLLAVPRWRGRAPDRAYEDWLHARMHDGHELAVHGCTHTDEGAPDGWLDAARRRWYTAGEGEFAAIDESEATRRLRVGMDWFRANGWPLEGFIAPAWLLSEGTRRALAQLPFRYTCTLNTVVALPEAVTLHSRSLVYSTRAAWRRACSLAWVALMARTEHARPLLRFELHPADLDHAAIRRSWMRHLDRALIDHRPVTLAQAAAALSMLRGRGIALSRR